MDVPEIHRAVHPLDPACTRAAEPARHEVRGKGSAAVRAKGREDGRLGREGGLGDKGLGGGGLGLLCGDLLRFGDVGAAVFTVVDALAGPVGFSRESVDDLGAHETLFNLIRKNPNLGCNGDTKKMDKTNILIPNNLDLINQAKPAEIVSELFFRHGFL